MRTTSEKIYNAKDFDGLNISKLAKVVAPHFTKPVGLSDKGFEKKLKKEFKGGYIDIVVRETKFRRKLV